MLWDKINRFFQAPALYKAALLRERIQDNTIGALQKDLNNSRALESMLSDQITAMHKRNERIDKEIMKAVESAITALQSAPSAARMNKTDRAAVIRAIRAVWEPVTKERPAP